ncbi:hypothetical protein H4R22_003376 [Coemansia sp. RSA 1290]|nr:hypothetical protein H4R22_003376 [Coemansia sp. RSA 1290]KAJ2645950.1 hypothetical protein IWW40_005761 [Coemansia sp. RSA 1250]
MRRFPANVNLSLAALVAAQAANGQFQFNPGTFDASELQLFLSAHYYSYASIWEGQLSEASASLPGAYSILTSIYNTDEIPPTYDADFVSNLAQEMVSIGHTTVVDPQIDSNTLRFTPTESGSSGSSEPTQSVSETSDSNESTQSASEPQSSEDVFTLSSESDNSDTTSDGSSVYSKSMCGGLALSMALASALAYF